MFPTENFLPKATLTPTQKISAEPTKEISEIRLSLIKSPKSAATQVIAP